MAQEPSDRLIGSTIDGRYQVESRIARGGMAKVYLATDLRLERKVAVKVMHDHLVDDAEYAAKFIREARHTARLAHPNIVSVFDQGHEGDILFLVMEYLPGITLRELLNDYGSLTVEQALDITTAVLQALVVAHREGILHRDVKPENVMLVNDGRIKVGDFGLARPVTSATETGKSLLGTVAYIAPELLTRGQADNRSDLYSVGVMLYEMLAGKQPFTGDTPMQIAMQHAKKQMPLASLTNPFVGQAVDDVIQWSTAKDPNDRPKDARAFLEALRKASVRRVSDATHVPTDAVDDDEAIEESVTVTGDDATSIIESALADEPDDGVTTPITAIVSEEKQKSKRAVPTMPQMPTIKIPRISLPAKKAKKSVVTEGDVEAAPRRRRRGLPALLALVIAIAAVGGGVSWWYSSGPGSMAHMVDVRGMEATAAAAALTDADFVVLEPATEEYDDEVVAGAVIGVTPEITGDAKKGTEVRLIVSKGPQPIEVPVYDNITVEAYSAQLAGLKIAVTNTDDQFSATIAKGLVINVLTENGTIITAGSTLYHGDAVVLERSLGPVPVVTGKTAAEATTALQNVGLTVVVSETRQYSDTVPDGKVISATVTPGVVRPGDTVSLVISKGPELIEVPNVVGMTIKKANDTLVSAGFQVIIITELPREFWDVNLSTVKKQSVDAGTKVAKNSTVKIFGKY
ncbi:MAG: Stk1 family PASTA domain-containing Ser/Thr kinase [Microbacteriaceae bacterium]